MKRVFRMAAICMLLCGLVLPLSVHAKEANAQFVARMGKLRLQHQQKERIDYKLVCQKDF